MVCSKCSFSHASSQMYGESLMEWGLCVQAKVTWKFPTMGMNKRVVIRHINYIMLVDVGARGSGLGFYLE